MAPEKRERKKPAKYDPHPPGSKHQMMSARSKKLKEKKQAKNRMQKLRGGDKNEAVEATPKETADKENVVTDKADDSGKETAEQNPKNN